MKTRPVPSVFLAGPPCSGKSSAGRQLSRMLDLPFLDLDDVIEARSGMSIPEIFSAQGEPGFRRLEAAALAECLEGDGEFVMALGGGCLLDPLNMAMVTGRGVLVTLTATDDVLAERLGKQEAGRPLSLSSSDLLNLLETRREHYESLPNRIDTSTMTPVKVAEAVIGILSDPI